MIDNTTLIVNDTWELHGWWALIAVMAIVLMLCIGPGLLLYALQQYISDRLNERFIRRNRERLHGVDADEEKQT